MSVKSMSVTHITNKMLADKKPFDGSEMKKELQALLKDGVLVAHNAKFDIGILKAEGIEVPRYICTLRIARHLDENSVIPEYNLQFLRYYLDLEIDGNAHDAECDVKTLCAIFDRQFSKIKESFKEEKESEEKAIQKMLEISSKPTLFKKFNFGKYKDQKISDVLLSDRGYLEWMLGEKSKTPDPEEDWIFTLQSYLKPHP